MEQPQRFVRLCWLRVMFLTTLVHVDGMDGRLIQSPLGPTSPPQESLMAVPDKSQVFGELRVLRLVDPSLSQRRPPPRPESNSSASNGLQGPE